MDINDLNNYLGAFASEATDGQREAIMDVSDIVDRVFPGEDQRDDNQEMLAAAVQAILGDEEPAKVVDEWKAATKAVWAATVRMRGAIAVEVARSNELAVSEKYGVSRPTVRKAMGK